MPSYTTKAQLYKFIDILRDQTGTHEGPVDAIKTVNNYGNIYVEYSNFGAAELCGVAFIGDKTDTIVLNSNRTNLERNFDCAHEFIHLRKHRNENVDCFHCFQSARPSQNFSLEWQANEGAAEWIISYRTLLPAIKNNRWLLQDWNGIQKLKCDLSNCYNTSTAVIKYRLESLKYEIDQYLNGVDLQDIEILSNKQQIARGIKVKSINALQDDLFEESKGKKYEPLYYVEPIRKQEYYFDFSSDSAYDDINFVEAENRWLYDF